MLWDFRKEKHKEKPNNDESKNFEIDILDKGNIDNALEGPRKFQF